MISSSTLTASPVNGHEAEVVAVQVAEGEEFALAGLEAAGGGEVGRERFPEFVAAFPKFVELEGKGGRGVVDADEMELGEVGEQNPRDGLIHRGDFGTEPVILDVAEHLLAVFVEQAFAVAIMQALGLDEQQRPFGLQQVVHRIAEDFEFRPDVLLAEAQRVKQRQNQFMAGGGFRFLPAKAGRLQPFGFGQQRFQFGGEGFVHRTVWEMACPGFTRHSGRHRADGTG